MNKKQISILIVTVVIVIMLVTAILCLNIVVLNQLKDILGKSSEEFLLVKSQIQVVNNFMGIGLLLVTLSGIVYFAKENIKKN